MNLADLRRAVYDTTGFPTTDGFITPAVVDGQINAAIRYISLVRPWRWLEATDTTNTTTTSGTASYAVPSDYVATRSVNINGQICRSVGAEEYDASAYADYRPSHYTYVVEGSNLKLYPTPDGAYTIVHRYTKVEPTLADDLKSPLMPSVYHDAIITRASYTTLLRANEPTRAAVYQAQYQDWEKRMIASFEAQNPKRIRVRPGSLL